MPITPTFADRVWYAIHCLPRDPSGKPPSERSIERAHKLPHGFLSKIARGDRKGVAVSFDVMERLAKALRCSAHWIQNGGDTDLTLSGFLPPRPHQKWKRCADVAGWHEAVSIALADVRQKVPAEAFLAAAEMPAFIPADRMTPAMAIAAANFCWEFSTPNEQAKYSTALAKTASAGQRAVAIRKRSK